MCIMVPNEVKFRRCSSSFAYNDKKNQLFTILESPGAQNSGEFLLLLGIDIRCETNLATLDHNTNP